MLSSRYIGKQLIESQNPSLTVHRFNILERFSSPPTDVKAKTEKVYRSDPISFTFYSKAQAGENRNLQFPAYEIIQGNRDGQKLPLLVSSVELMRFFPGLDLELARYLFSFLNDGSNDKLFRIGSRDLISKKITELVFTDQELSFRSQKIIAWLYSSDHGLTEMLRPSKTVRRAKVRAELLKSDAEAVYPEFYLPYPPSASLEVLGKTQTIELITETSASIMEVFAVTKILKTTYKPPAPKIKVSLEERRTDNPEKSNPYIGRMPVTGDYLPKDARNRSNNNALVRERHSPNEDEDFPGLKKMPLKVPILEVITDEKQRQIIEPDEPQVIENTSTIPGPDKGGSTGLGVPINDDDPEARERRSLVLCDPSLQNLRFSIPSIVLSPHEDLEWAKIEELPFEFHMLRGMVERFSKRGWTSRFFPAPESSGSYPLLKLDQLTPTKSSAKKVINRKGLVARLEGQGFCVTLLDISRDPKNAREPIGVYAILSRGRTDVPLRLLSYLFQQRLSPAISSGSWPSSDTHGGGYVATVIKHRETWLRNSSAAADQVGSTIDRLLKYKHFCQ